MKTANGFFLEIKEKSKKQRDLSPWKQQKGSPIYLLKGVKPALEEARPTVLEQVSTNHIWCGCENGLIITYGLKTGARLKIMKAHEQKIYSIQVVGNQKIWTAGADGKIKIWSITEEAEIKLLNTLESECQVIRSLLLVKKKSLRIEKKNNKKKNLYKLKIIEKKKKKIKKKKN